MPEIETLMQVWPSEFEEELKEMSLPSGDIDLSVKEYASLMCALLDVPIYESTVQSLHVLFTLFAEFKANQHFQAVPGGEDGESLKLDGSDAKENSDELSDDNDFN